MKKIIYLLALLLYLLALLLMVSSVSALCYDSDAYLGDVEAQAFVKGTTASLSVSKTDYCAGSYAVEFTCFEGQPHVGALVVCEFGCEDGACLRVSDLNCVPDGSAPAGGRVCCEGLIVSQCDGLCIRKVYGANYAYGDCVCSPDEPPMSSDCVNNYPTCHANGQPCYPPSETSGCCSGICSAPVSHMDVRGVCLSIEELDSVSPCWSEMGYVGAPRCSKNTLGYDIVVRDYKHADCTVASQVVTSCHPGSCKDGKCISGGSSFLSGLYRSFLIGTGATLILGLALVVGFILLRPALKQIPGIGQFIP